MIVYTDFNDIIFSRLRAICLAYDVEIKYWKYKGLYNYLRYGRAYIFAHNSLNFEVYNNFQMVKYLITIDRYYTKESEEYKKLQSVRNILIGLVGLGSLTE